MSTDELNARPAPQSSSSPWVPPFTVDVTWFPSNEGELSPQIGAISLALYDMLRRPVSPAPGASKGAGRGRSGPFAFALSPGVGMEVLLGRDLSMIADELSSARRGESVLHTVVVLLDGSAILQNSEPFIQALRGLGRLAEDPQSRVLFLPVALVPDWIDSGLCASLLDMTGAPEGSRPQAVSQWVAVEVARRATQLVEGHDGRVSLFVSRSRSDPEVAEGALRKLRSALFSDERMAVLFDLRMEAPEEVAAALWASSAPAMLLTLHTDHYAESPRCEKELLVAKQRGMPVVSVLLLQSQERRSPPYGANMLNIVWHEGSEAGVLQELLRVWLHHIHFRQYGRAVAKLAGLRVEPSLLSRPPELLDFAQGVIPSDGGVLVLYPDPPLPAIESGVVQRAYPRARLVTPTTLAGCLMRPGYPVPPLAGVQVSFSLSQSPDIPEVGKGRVASGVTNLHVDDVIAHLTLCLVRAGAQLAYGGHLKRGGYTDALLALIRAHNQLGLPEVLALRAYVAAYLKKTVEISLIAPPTWVGEDLPCDDDIGRALQLREMRRRMAQDGSALIALGGKMAPNGHPGAGSNGYSGRFPGLLEEAWANLKRNNAVFAAGGFGGAAQWIADLLLEEAPAHPELLDEQALCAASPRYSALCEAWRSQKNAEPESLSVILKDIRAAGEELRRLPERKVWRNGLTLADNRRLASSRNAAEIAHLVMKGLFHLESDRNKERGSNADSKPVVRVYSGHAADAPGAGAYLILGLRGAVLSEEEALIDKRLGGSLSARLLAQGDKGRSSPEEKLVVETFSARGHRLSGDWVCLVAVDPRSASSKTQKVFSETLATLFEHAVANGLHELVLVPSNIWAHLPADDATQLILDALCATPKAARLTLTLCESDPRRYEAVKSRVELTAKVKPIVIAGDPAVAPIAAAVIPLTLHAQRSDDESKLEVSVWAPADDAGPLVPRAEPPFDAFEQLGEECRDSYQDDAPSFEALADLGSRLAKVALPDRLRGELLRFKGRPLDIVHDEHAAGVPWEALCLDPELPDAEGRPGLSGGIRRRLFVSVEGPSKPLGTTGETRRILLISNPTSDLGGAEEETSGLVTLWQSLPGLCVEVLRGAEATLEATVAKLSEPWDVLHYSGHAFFDSAEQGQSGLKLSGHSVLTAADIMALARVPPFIFLNACQSARVRGGGGPPPSKRAEDIHGQHGALAEAFLRAGARLLIGNFWPVSDDAAVLVARITYEQLLRGVPVGAALVAAKRRLFDKQERDWASYVLYGDASWQW